MPACTRDYPFRFHRTMAEIMAEEAARTVVSHGEPPRDDSIIALDFLTGETVEIPFLGEAK